MIIGLVLLSLLIIYVILTIVELTNLYRFNLGYYDRGFKIYKREIVNTFSNWRDLDGIFYGKEGNYVFLPELKIGYFITKYKFYRSNGLLGYQTVPLTIFGMFEEKHGLLVLTYYISYRLVFLLSVLFFFCLIIPFLTGKLIAILFSLCFISATLLIIYIVHTFQQGRMLLMSDEIAKILKIRNNKY